VRGSVVRVQVQRVPPARVHRSAVAVVGRPRPRPLDLDLAWRAHVRRFGLEHTVRFAKQTLGWTTTPAAAPPAQAERWLVVAGYAQLRLARQLVADSGWRGAAPPTRTAVALPGRRGFPRLPCALGSPASAPNPSGRSPGRPKGHRPGPALRHPAVNKPATKPTKKARKKPTRVAKAA
jgi:hypothetical protein